MKAATISRGEGSTPRREQRLPQLALLAPVLALAAAVGLACSGGAEEDPTPTPYPRYEMTEEHLRLIPLGPTDLPDGSPTLVVSPESGGMSNNDLAEQTRNTEDTETTWDELGRLTGFGLDLEGHAPGLFFVHSAVDYYVDEAAARRGFSEAARDFWVEDAQRSDGIEIRDREEHAVAGLGDNALFQGATLLEGNYTAQTASIGFRRGNLVAVVGLSRVQGADGEGADVDVETLARLLDERITAVANGTQTWEAVAIPATSQLGEPPPSMTTASGSTPPTAPEDELAIWARDFCAASQASTTRTMNAQLAYESQLSSEMEVAALRSLSITFLTETWQTGQELWNTIVAIPRPARSAELGIDAFYDALDAYAQWEVGAYTTYLARAEAATTAPQLAGIFIELGLTAIETPEFAALIEAYEGLHPSVDLAIGAAGPCGDYAPGEYLGQVA